MKERPILFSSAMVRAILSGAKTQTRRAVKPQPVMRGTDDCVIEYGKQRHSGPPAYLLGDILPRFGCPYGQTGERLWVREKWRIGAWDEIDGKFAIDYCDGPRKEWLSPNNYVDEGEQFNRLWEQSTDDAIKVYGHQEHYKWEPGNSPCRWRPSIHMPRWACRLVLEIVSVRVERLQDISEADAKAEGAEPAECCMAHYHGFSKLWQSINGEESWNANPWVWVIEFRRVEA